MEKQISVQTEYLSKDQVMRLIQETQDRYHDHALFGMVIEVLDKLRYELTIEPVTVERLKEPTFWCTDQSFHGKPVHQYFCARCGGKESSPRHFCPRCGRDAKHGRLSAEVREIKNPSQYFKTEQPNERVL